MLEGIAMFVRTMFGIWNSIQAGVALGNALSGDGQDALNAVLSTAHVNAWNDIINNGGLNAGQLSMALMCQVAGGDFLSGMNFESWSPEEYMSACGSAAEGASEALSHSIEKAATAVNHAAVSTYGGLAKWAAEQRFLA